MIYQFDPPKAIEILAASATTLFAAYFGAKLAFSLQNLKASRDLEARNVAAANYALFQIIISFNFFSNIRDQFISEFSDNPDRDFLIQPLLLSEFESPKFNFQDLSFVADPDPNLLLEIYLLEQTIYIQTGLISVRSRFHLDTIQPAMERVQLATANKFSRENLQNELGPRNSHTLTRMTNDMISGIDEAIAKCVKISDDLYRTMKKKYPSEKFLKLATKPN